MRLALRVHSLTFRTAGRLLKECRSGAVISKVDSWIVEPFSEGLASFEPTSWRDYLPILRGRSKFRGYIDKTGKVVIPANYAYAGPFKEGLAAVALDGKCWVYSYAGESSAPSAAAKQTSCGPVRDPSVTAPCLHGYIDKSGKFRIAAKFEFGRDFSEHLAAVVKGGKWGYIDASGTEIVRYEYEDARPFSNGRAAVWDGRRWGFVDRLGVGIIALEFDSVKPFSSGLAAVKKGSGWYYINTGGVPVIRGPYIQATPFVLGLAHVQTGASRWAWIDERGKTVFAY
jgi:hypothetical protein